MGAPTPHLESKLSARDLYGFVVLISARILCLFCDFVGFKNLPNVEKERPLITNLSKAKAAKPDH